MGKAMNAQEQADQDMTMLRHSAEQLAEHFDTVQILVTRHDPAQAEGTIRAHYGLGNICARYGHAKEFVLHCEVGMTRGPQQ